MPGTTEMICGDIQKTILDSSQYYNLLALGQRGNFHEKDVLYLGSNFRHIAHHASVPLLISSSTARARVANDFIVIGNLEMIYNYAGPYHAERIG